MSSEEYRVFDRTSFPRERPEPLAPTVNFSATTGVVYLSKGTCQLMALHAGDRLEIVQRGNDPLALGIRKTNNEMGFKIHQKKDGQCFAAARLVRNILLGFGRSESTTVQLASEPTNGIYWIMRGSIDRRP